MTPETARLHAQHDVTSDPNYARLKDAVIRMTGLSYYAQRDADLVDRLVCRMEANQVETCSNYLQLLEIDVDELHRLAADLTIGETYFFRHAEMFTALRNRVFPELIARNATRKSLRIWSAGCSIGAEPYSIAILLKRELEHLTRDWDLQIVATDINHRYLELAKRGEYEEWAFRSVPQQVKETCFEWTGARWRISPQFADCVTFQHHNLVEEELPGGLTEGHTFDLILCRNVIIYFDKQLSCQILDRFYRHLVPSGWLCVGHSEPNCEMFRQYRPIHVDGAVLYQRPGSDQLPTTSQFGFQCPDTKNPPTPNARRDAAFPLVDDCRTLQWQDAESPSHTPRQLRHRRESSTIENDRKSSLGNDHVAVNTEASDGVEAEIEAILNLADASRLKEALLRSEELLQSHNLSSRCHFIHSTILEQLGRDGESLAALKRTLFLNRSDVLAHYFLGTLLNKLGRRKAATRAFCNADNLLEHMRPEQIISSRDGLTAADLAGFVNAQLNKIEGVHA